LAQVTHKTIGNTKLADKIIIITSLSGQAGKYIKVNAGGTDLEFGTVSGGPGDTTHYVAFSKVIGLIDSLLEKADITLLANYLPLSVFDDSLLSYIAFNLGDDDSLVTGASVIEYLAAQNYLSGDMDDIPDGTTYVKTENNYTDADASKLSGIAAGAEVNVNADWNSGSGDSQILNKPTLGTAAAQNVEAFAAALGADDNYVTDAEKIVIGNTSGTNSGDNATNSQYSGLAASKQDVLVSGTNIKTINSTSLLGSGDIAIGGSPTGVFDDLQISILQGDGNLAEASGVQTWAGSDRTTQDVFTVTANTTYIVEGRYIINTGATTHTTALAWSTGATITSFQYETLLWSAAANTITTAQSTTHVTGVASKVINATSTAVYTNIRFKGILVVGSVAGGSTITPQISFSANPTGTCLMKRGSWISFTKIGSDTDILKGGWN
jgi:hypothetical protein